MTDGRLSQEPDSRLGMRPVRSQEPTQLATVLPNRGCSYLTKMSIIGVRYAVFIDEWTLSRYRL